MLKLKNFRALILSSIIFITPTILNADSTDFFSSINGEKAIRQKVLNCQEKNKRKKRSKYKPLELKDFTGSWVAHGHSIGGITGTDGIGASSSALFSIAIKPDGKGVISEGGSLVIYNGPDDVNVSPFLGKVEIEITNRRDNSGTMTIFRPDSSAPDGINIGVFDFIAQRSIKNGQVIKILSHRVSSNTTQSELVFQELIRQYLHFQE